MITATYSFLLRLSLTVKVRHCRPDKTQQARQKVVNTLTVCSKATFSVPLAAVRSRLGQYTNSVVSVLSTPPSSALIALIPIVCSGQGKQLLGLLLLYTHPICAFAARPWPHVMATGCLGRAHLLGDVKNPCPSALDLPLMRGLVGLACRQHSCH